MASKPTWTAKMFDENKALKAKIKELEATITKLESESTGDKISLAKCHERSREKDKRIANLQAIITNPGQFSFPQNNWVNPTGEE